MKAYYMVLNKNTNYTRYVHSDYRSAKLEAIRLVRANPQYEFVVLKAVAAMKMNDVEIDELDSEFDEDCLPF